MFDGSILNAPHVPPLLERRILHGHYYSSGLLRWANTIYHQRNFVLAKLHPWHFILSDTRKSYLRLHGYAIAVVTRHQHYMMTSSNGNIFRVTGPLCGEFPGPGEFPAQRPVTRSFDDFFDLRPNKRLSKQLTVVYSETPSWSLWRQCNETAPSVSTNRQICSWKILLKRKFIFYDTISSQMISLGYSILKTSV